MPKPKKPAPIHLDADLNVAVDPFFPVVLRSGARRRVSFPELFDESADPPIEFDWGRGDMDTASFELACGMATMALRLKDEDAWSDVWEAPPKPASIAEAMAPFAGCFSLFAGRFMQDMEDVVGAENVVEALLIDTPGQNGQKKNSDVLTHRGRYPALSLPTVAMALYTLQAYASVGGAGNRVGMRGGGPMTCMVIPMEAGGVRAPLSRRILANVVPTGRLSEKDVLAALPWMRPTLVSDGKPPALVHPSRTNRDAVEVYFSMPRRIRLHKPVDGHCSMTGVEGPVVEGYVQKTHGNSYGSAWAHPMTPYRREKTDSEPYTVKPKSTVFTLRDWVGVVVGGAETKLAMPASVVRLSRERRSELLSLGGDPIVRAAGWAMNQSDPAAYLLGEQSLHLGGDAKRQAVVDEWARRLAGAADIVGNMVAGRLKEALFDPKTKITINDGLLGRARSNFAVELNERFHRELDRLGSGEPQKDIAKDWLRIMQDTALKIFWREAPMSVADPVKSQCRIKAAGYLRWDFQGTSTTGGKLYEALMIPAPPKKEKQESPEETK